MLDAYNALMKHLAQSKVMKKARVKNGFLHPESTKGYRDIKVNVIFESEEGTKMICEIQLIYGQNLNEKKRSHRYYHLTRERAFYEGVTQKEAEITLNPESFQQIMNVRQDVEVSDNSFHKCAVNSELELVFLKPCSHPNDKLICVNMVDRKMVFETPAYNAGHHTHHWLKLQNQHHLSVQSSKNVMKFLWKHMIAQKLGLLCSSASGHLYKRVCPSVGQSVGRSLYPQILVLQLSNSPIGIFRCVLASLM